MIMFSKENMIMVYLENPPGPEGSNGIQNFGCWRGADWKRSRGNLSGHLARLKPVRLSVIPDSSIINDMILSFCLVKSCFLTALKESISNYDGLLSKYALRY
jgi:hypothetical protein